MQNKPTMSLLQDRLLIYLILKQVCMGLVDLILSQTDLVGLKKWKSTHGFIVVQLLSTDAEYYLKNPTE